MRVRGSRSAFAKKTTKRMAKNCACWYMRTSRDQSSSIGAVAKSTVVATSSSERRLITIGRSSSPKARMVATYQSALGMRSGVAVSPVMAPTTASSAL